MGYTEPLRRFIQHEGFTPQVNPIPNQMPSWMPGSDYLTDFHTGDPYIKVDQGFARLPGAGYEAIHPELEDVDPEDYPDITKLRILADVAPYSREYQRFAARVRSQARNDPDLEAEYGRISEQVRQTKGSTLQVAQKHFNAPVDTVEGTVKSVHGLAVELNEYPGRTFHFSSVGGSMADLTRSLPRAAYKIPSRAGRDSGTPAPPAVVPSPPWGSLHPCPCIPPEALSTGPLSGQPSCSTTASGPGWLFSLAYAGQDGHGAGSGTVFIPVWAAALEGGNYSDSLRSGAPSRL